MDDTSSHPSKKQKKLHVNSSRYLSSWEEHPNLKEWLRPMLDDIQSAFCKACRKPLHAHKKDLLLHSKAKKHLKNLQEYRETYDAKIPLKDVEVGDGTYEIPMSKMKVDRNNTYENLEKNITLEIFSESSAQTVQQCPSYAHELLQAEASIVIENDHDSTDTPFNQWKNSPEFRNWLGCDELKNIYCKPCGKQLKNNKTFWIKHATTSCHKRECKKKGICVLDPYPAKADDLVFNTENTSENDNEKIVDLRSDTITLPNTHMKAAMLNARLGDDFYKDDPTVKALQEKVASLLRKERGLLFPSGTMANLVAVMSHNWSRDSEVIVGDKSFLHSWSQGGLSRLGGIHVRTIKNESDGTINVENLNLSVQNRQEWVDQTLVCIENPVHNLGGRVLPFRWIEEVGEFCETNELLLHMDGARLLNASIACGRNPEELVQFCTSATLCLNKGLGAPMGSVLVGSADFIEKAHRLRSLLGGTMHQSGIFSAAGIYALDHIKPKLHWDHANARAIAQGVQETNSSAVTVELKSVQTNVVHLETDNVRVKPTSFCERLIQVFENEEKNIGERIKIYLTPVDEKFVRLVTHYDLSKIDIQYVIRKLQFVIRGYDNMIDNDCSTSSVQEQSIDIHC